MKNIQQSATINYGEVWGLVQQLNTGDTLRLIEDLAHKVRVETSVPRHSILELRGLGKEIWRKIDVQAYIDEERNSWGEHTHVGHVCNVTTREVTYNM